LSELNLYVNVENLRTWSEANKMITNLKKTKEMIIGSLAKQPISCLTIQSGVIERVDAMA